MKEYFRLQEEMINSESARRIARFNHLMISLGVFIGNYREASKVVRYHNKPERMRDIWIQRNAFMLHDLQSEVLRHLHNFVASAMALVDHARKLNMSVTEYGVEILGYQIEVDRRFKEDGLHRFIKDLRNYMLHWGMPPINSSYKFGENGGRVFLSKSQLLHFKNWQTPSKVFLDKSGDEIDLEHLIEDYYNNVFDFYKWFEEAFRLAHEGDLKEIGRINDAIRARWAKIVPWMLNVSSMSLSPPYRLEQAEGCFSGILMPNDWREIYAVPANPTDRCRVIVEILQKAGVSDEPVIEKVRKIFSDVLVKE